MFTARYGLDLRVNILNLQSPVVTICTTSLSLQNSTFCPHSVFMCFVWISEQTAIISLYNINLLVFINETESVYCAVRTESLYNSNNDYYYYLQLGFQPVAVVILHVYKI